MDEQPAVGPPFIDAAQLRVALANRRVHLADVRWALDGSQGHGAYLTGHLPGAVFVDLDTDLAAPPDLGRHPLPSPEHFAAVLGRIGVLPGELVVAYDQGPGAIAARLVWMCRVIGQPASVLSGGLAGWDGPLDTGAVTATPVDRARVAWPADRLADADLVDRLRTDPTAVVIDARDPARYRGQEEPIDARPGHVPGAVNVPVADNLDVDGRLLSVGELRARYEAVGALDASQVVAYCGSGVTACHDLLALETIGVRGRLFPGSWSAWSADPARPAASGPGGDQTHPDGA